MEPAPLLVLLAAPPGTPGCAEALAVARARHDAGAAVRVLLLHSGLAWSTDPWLREWPASRAVCSRDAREQGWSLEHAPRDVAWSSVTAALGDLEPQEETWFLLP